jgi:hypothetical protein
MLHSNALLSSPLVSSGATGLAGATFSTTGSGAALMLPGRLGAGRRG